MITHVHSNHGNNGYYDYKYERKLVSMSLPLGVMMDSGWNWIPSLWYFLCRSPIINPSSVQAVISKDSGKLGLSTINEWYRMAWKGLGNPLNTPVSLWWIKEVLPCLISFALITVPPNDSPRHWWPKQTPNIGNLGAKYLIVSLDIPASVGLQGPGEMISPSGFNCSICSIAVSYTHLTLPTKRIV